MVTRGRSGSIRVFLRCAGTAALALGVLGLTGCGEPSSPGGSATLSVHLTDMPGDVERAWVEVLEITLMGEGGETLLYDAETAGPLGLIELTELTGGTSQALVEGLVIPAGTYTQLRFVLGRAALQTTGGDIYATSGVTLADLEGATGTIAGDLTCPSCTQSGLKVTLPGGHITLEATQQVVMVDFDVSQSYGRLAGGSGQWVMHPVMHATEVELSGGISGTVTLITDDAETPHIELSLSCGGQTLDASALLQLFVPTATSATVVETGQTAADGSYAITFVQEGTYTMGFEATFTFENGDALSFSDVTVTPTSVDVGPNAGSTADYTVAGATCTTAGG